MRDLQQEVRLQGLAETAHGDARGGKEVEVPVVPGGGEVVRDEEQPEVAHAVSRGEEAGVRGVRQEVSQQEQPARAHGVPLRTEAFVRIVR